MFFFTDVTRRMRVLLSADVAQSSVETALLLPIAMGVIALLIQPACLLYTRIVMSEAACEALRVLATAEGSDAAGCERMVRRRLDSIPAIPVFRVGGSDAWDIDLMGMGTGKASVSIRGRVRSLPLLGAFAFLFGEMDGEEVILDVEARMDAKPEWLSGSYGDWVTVWG